MLATTTLRRDIAQLLDKARINAVDLMDQTGDPVLLYFVEMALLEVLAQHARLGVITNFDGRFRVIAQQLGLDRFFDPIVISSEIGADKPHEQIFRRALQAARVAADQALHVGDDPLCDWEGAEKVGMRVFRLQRPQVTLLDLLTSLRLSSPS